MSKIILALDFSCKNELEDLMNKVTPDLCKLKVGKELYMSLGPQIVDELIDKGFDIFLDLKFHDIPNTVYKACYAASEKGIWMLNVHTSGGRDMLIAATNAIKDSKNNPYLIGVTMLTSLDSKDLKEIGFSESLLQNVLNLSTLAKMCGLNGVVCSPLEVEIITHKFGKDFIKVTPGIRLAGQDSTDQKRFTNPLDAIQRGSTYLVIGRSITNSSDPKYHLETLNNEIKRFISYNE